MRKIVEKIESRVSTYRRSLVYEIANNAVGLRSEKVGELMDDLALTIDVHPYCLGIRSEWKGQVYVPEGCQLVLHEVHNIFEFSDGNKSLPRTYGHGTYPIPGMIEKLEVLAVGQEIRAVIVTEHRNVKAYLEYMAGSGATPGLKGVMLVMLGGYGDFAAREFLCLLSKNADVSGVPFLWISDCDSDGLSIFAKCKYGAKVSAWASPIMICPPLQYAGMNKAMLDDALAKYADRQMEHAQRRNPNISPAEVAKLLKMHQETAEAKKAALLRNDLSLTQRQRAESKLKSLDVAGYLTKGQDPLAVEACESLLAGQAPLKMSCVTQVDAHGIVYAIRDSVAAALNEDYADVPVLMLQNSLRAAFETVNSQAAPVAHSQEMIDEDVEEELVEAENY